MTNFPKEQEAAKAAQNAPMNAREEWMEVLRTAFIAVVVFERIGVGILRRAWFNLDLIWSAALIATGTLTLMR